jgi:toxin-antitoxin system PIN domain toxin
MPFIAFWITDELSVDTDILLYASDQESPHHERVKKFLEARGEDPDLLCLSWVTLMGYQRIATHPSIFRNPLSAQLAWGNVKGLLALPRCRVITEQEGFNQEYEQVSRTVGVKGNLVPDAHLAVILRQHGVSKIYTADTDFRKFEFLTVVNPLE